MQAHKLGSPAYPTFFQRAPDFGKPGGIGRPQQSVGDIKNSLTMTVAESSGFACA